MIEGISPIVQSALGTLFTWGLTAAGSALVFFFSSTQRSVLDGSLGFAAGVMTAASYWSLLSPALENAKESGMYGDEGQYAFIPVAIGFIAGAAFVYVSDKFLPSMDPAVMLSIEREGKPKDNVSPSIYLTTPANGNLYDYELSSSQKPSGGGNNRDNHSLLVDLSGLKRRGGSRQDLTDGSAYQQDDDDERKYRSVNQTTDDESVRKTSWRRISLLILAIIVHNIPEGLAVGVGFGAVGKTPSATFASARSLAIGIGIQNFPEGLAVSLPLRGTGMSPWKCFWYGQLSGMVEPIAGIVGAAAIVIAEPILPYTLAFAAGAMIYVVVDDIIPEAHTHGNGRLASIWCVIGFVVMMSLDVGLG